MGNSVKINFVGDVALFREFERVNVDPFKEVSLPEANYNVANFEFPVSKLKEKYFYDVSDEYLVSYDYARGLFYEKFDLYGVANNHIFDYGDNGVRDTVELLKATGCDVFGVSTSKGFDVHTENIEGIEFAFIAAVKFGRWVQKNGTLGPNVIDYDALNIRISDLSAQVDHVVVYLHWGTELVDAPIPSDVDESKRMINSGASCVIGHHPHVPQGITEYKHGLIAYSLGSFIYLSEFEKGNRDRTSIRDISVCLTIKFDSNLILSYVPHQYKRDIESYVPRNCCDFKDDQYFKKLNSVIGDKNYYTSKVRSILFKREIFSFIDRFKEKPLSAVWHYLTYIKLDHFKKIFGVLK